MRNHRWLQPLLAVSSAAVLLGNPISAQAAGAPPKVHQVSTDPFTNPDSQHASEVEADTVAFGGTVVSAFQAGRFFASGGSSGIGFATSKTAGRSWTSGFLPGITIYTTPPGPFARATDVSVAYDAKHGTWLASILACNGAGCFAGPDSIIVSHSADGLTWSSPVSVVVPGIYDHPWVACDRAAGSPFFGRCYVSIVNLGAPGMLTVASNDGGLTWSAPVSVAGVGILMSIVQPNGTLVVVGGEVASLRSTDGGVTFSPVVLVSTVSHHPDTGMRSVPAPSIQVDAAGKLYVYWSDCRFRAGCTANDIVYSTSNDGITWSAVKRIPIDKVTSGVDHFIPGLGVDPATSGASTHLALTYYYFPNAACTFPSPDTCALDLGFTSSTDGGLTWSHPHRLNKHPMDLTWLPDTQLGRMVGDYMSTAFASGNTVSVSAIASAPVGTRLQEAMFASVG